MSIFAKDMLRSGIRKQAFIPLACDIFAKDMLRQGTLLTA